MDYRKATEQHIANMQKLIVMCKKGILAEDVEEESLKNPKIWVL